LEAHQAGLLLVNDFNEPDPPSESLAQPRPASLPGDLLHLRDSDSERLGSQEQNSIGSPGRDLGAGHHVYEYSHDNLDETRHPPLTPRILSPHPTQSHSAITAKLSNISFAS
jgi:hypothetical protein